MRGPIQFLRDWAGKRTPIRIERAFTVSDAYGVEASFDPMLSTFLGGYSAGHAPRTTQFNLRGVPIGTYELYLYGAQKDGVLGTDFYVQVNDGTVQTKTIVPSGSVFAENLNYARFSIVLYTNGDLVHVTAVGFINGMQLKRV